MLTIARYIPAMLAEAGHGRSIATRAALWLSVATATVFLLAGTLAFRDARSQAFGEALVQLDGFNRELAAQQEARFQRLVAAHRHATELMLAELRTAPAGTGDRSFDALFPRQPDGTRRSQDGLFDGARTPLGYIRGVGGFIRAEPDPAEAQRLLAALRVVHAVGEGLRPELSSLYFFTPDDSLVMFAPDRADRLRFYRRDAPANLSFQGEEFARISGQRANPARVTRCTSLQPIFYDRSRSIWTTGCMTPVDIDGVHVGSFGTSLLLDDLLDTPGFAGLPGADVILVSREGRLIRHPAHTRQHSTATERHLDLTSATDPELRAMWAFIQAQEGGPFTGHVPALGAYVSLRGIDTPGWHILTVQDEGIVHAQAIRVLWRVLITAAVCLTLQLALLFLIMNRQVGAPLRRLTRRVDALAARYRVEPLATPATAGADEVRRLASHFEDMADQIVRSHDTLERKVSARTRQLRKANAELQRLSEVDPLTGIFNRRKLMDLLAEATAGGDPSFSLLVLDIDHFKSINDTHGHQVGDAVLIDMAAAVAPMLRPGDAFGRVGGEEFMVILDGADAQAAMRVAERVRGRIARLSSGGMGAGAVTASIGVAQFKPGDTVAAVYQRADEALYAAKRRGRNCSMCTELTSLRAA